MFKRVLVLVLAVILVSLGAPARLPAADAPSTVTIAYQPGIGYTNLIVMKETGVLEKAFPGTKFDWKVLANGAAIRDGIIAGQIQIGAGASGPFLVGWDRGVGYKLIASLNEMDLWLVAKQPKFKTLKDFGPGTKIGLPAPDSVQAVVLRKAALDQLKDARALDQNLVAIQHPLGVAALAGGQLDGHISAPPFEQEEVAAGGHVVLRSFDIFGRSSFTLVYTTDPFAHEYPNFVRTFYRELSNATKLIRSNPEKVAEYLSKDSGGKGSAVNFKRWISDPDVNFSLVPHGMMRYARFMKEIGLIAKVPGSVGELELPMLGGVGD